MSEKGTINSFMWYGNDRVDIDRLLAQEGKKKVDVLITSYGTLMSEFSKWRKAQDKQPYEGGSIYDRESDQCLTKIRRIPTHRPR